MQNNLLFSITELSNLTGKTRPTLYKYISAYVNNNLDSIPYSFIKLFELMNTPNVKKRDIVEFCNATFVNVDKDADINELIKLIKENKEKIDISKIKSFIMEEIKCENKKVS